MPDWFIISLGILFALSAFGVVYGILHNAAVRARELSARKEKQKDAGHIPVIENWWFRTLRSAGIRVYPPLFVAVVVLFALMLALMFGDLFAHSLFLSFSLAGLVLIILMSGIAEMGRTRAIKFEEKLLDAVDLMIAALKAGETPRKALQTVSEVTKDPVKREFASLASKIESGMSIQQAVTQLVHEYPSEGVRMFCSILVAKWNAGGDLAPVLGSVNKVMRERLLYRMRLRSQMAGARVTSYMVGLFPYVVLWTIYSFIPTWIDRLVGHPLGIPLMVGAFFLQVLGFVWVRSMMRVEL